MTNDERLTELENKLKAGASTYKVLSHFQFSHLPPHLAAISVQFAELAVSMGSEPSNAETATCLRKLLEAKDCAVRAVL